LDRADGKEIHRLRFTTDASGQSAVYPTHDGRFLVVTGKMLRLYSPTFGEITSRSGPIGRSGQSQNWHVSVIPRGHRLYAYVEISQPFLLDADTLDTIPNPRPSDVAWWPEGNNLFRESRGSDAGLFDTDGHWVAMDPNSGSGNYVRYAFLNVPQLDFGGWAPKELKVVSASGQIVWVVKTHDKLDGFSSNGV